MPQTPIPPFYRFCFTILDPLIAFAGATVVFFSPSTVMSSFLPTASPTSIPHEQLFMYQQHASGLWTIAFLMAFLLRYTSDIGVWRLLQAAVSITDIVALWSIWHTLDAQGRGSIRAVFGAERGSIVVYVLILVLRLSFFAGVGLGGGKRAKSA